MLNCPTSYTELSRTGSTLNFVTFEMKDVDNFGKGKPYKTLVKVATPLDYYQFLQKFRFCIKNALFADFWSLKEFLGLSSPPMLSTLLLPGSYGQLSSSFWTSKAGYATSSPWFLTLLRIFSWLGRWKPATSFFTGCKSVSLGRFAPCQTAWTRGRRRQCPTSSPRTTSKVLIFLVWMVCSDFLHLRTKDNKFVQCALEDVLTQRLEKARADGLHITTVVHKVGVTNCKFHREINQILSRPTGQAPNSGTVECCVDTVVWLWSIKSPFAILQSRACIIRWPLWFVCLFGLSNHNNHRTAQTQSLLWLKQHSIIISWELTALLLVTVKLTQAFKLLPLVMLTLRNQDTPLASRSGSSPTSCLQLWREGRRWTRRTLWTAKRSRAFQMFLRSSARYQDKKNISY